MQHRTSQVERTYVVDVLGIRVDAAIESVLHISLEMRVDAAEYFWLRWLSRCIYPKNVGRCSSLVSTSFGLPIVDTLKMW